MNTKKSNIIVGSNVYLSREDNPFWDQRFVAQVQDFLMIKEIYKAASLNSKVGPLTLKQKDILKTEMRCIYAKNDPCWGYRDKEKMVVCACINGDCRHIIKCNKQYNADEAAFWIMSDKERLTYGNPDKLKLYYFVDLISDEEMKRYNADPEFVGRKYKTPQPILKDRDKQYESISRRRIDPITGRKMTAVGYRWVIADNSNYESENLITIWGFAEDLKHQDIVPKVKAKPIQKAQIIKKSKKKSKTSKDRKALEKQVRNNIKETVKLTELKTDYFGYESAILILCNEAEKAYVSSILLKLGIEHGYDSKDDIRLIALDELSKKSFSGIVMISSSIINDGHNSDDDFKWEILGSIEEMTELTVSNKEYDEVKCENQSRWCCRNMYGVTHICLNDADFVYSENKFDGLYEIEYRSNENGGVFMDKNGVFFANVDARLKEYLAALKNANEISSMPEKIQGIAVKVENGIRTILGMGYMRFVDY